MLRPIDPQIPAQYALRQSGRNWDALVRETADTLYTLAYAITGSERQAIRAVKAAYRDFYKLLNLPAQDVVERLMATLMEVAGRQIGVPLTGTAVEDGLHAPDASEDFIPGAFNDDPQLRRSMMEAVGQQTAQVRACATMFCVFGMSVAAIAAVMGCDEATIENRLNQVNNDVRAVVAGIREQSGARLHNPEMLGDLMRRSLPRVPKRLVGAVLGATSGAPLLNLSIGVRRALFANSAGAGASVQSGVAGSIIGGTVIGGILTVGTLLATGVVAIAIWSGVGVQTLETFVANAPQLNPAKAVRALTDQGYFRAPEASRIPAALPTVPPAPTPTPTPLPTATPASTAAAVSSSGARSAVNVVLPTPTLPAVATQAPPDATATPASTPIPTSDNDDPTSEPAPTSAPLSVDVNYLFGELGQFLVESVIVTSGGDVEYMSMLVQYYRYFQDTMLTQLEGMGNRAQYAALEALVEDYIDWINQGGSIGLYEYGGQVPLVIDGLLGDFRNYYESNKGGWDNQLIERGFASILSQSGAAIFSDAPGINSQEFGYVVARYNDDGRRFILHELSDLLDDSYAFTITELGELLEAGVAPPYWGLYDAIVDVVNAYYGANELLMNVSEPVITLTDVDLGRYILGSYTNDLGNTLGAVGGMDVGGYDQVHSILMTIDQYLLSISPGDDRYYQMIGDVFEVGDYLRDRYRLMKNKRIEDEGWDGKYEIATSGLIGELQTILDELEGVIIPSPLP